MDIGQGKNMTGLPVNTFTASLQASLQARLSPEFSQLVTTLDETIHSAAELDSAIKWRQLTYAVDSDFHHWICAINVTKKLVTLRFHFGSLLPDPEGILRAGESQWMRSLDFKPGEEVEREKVRGFVRQAVGKREYFKENWKRLQEDD